MQPIYLHKFVCGRLDDFQENGIQCLDVISVISTCMDYVWFVFLDDDSKNALPRRNILTMTNGERSAQTVTSFNDTENCEEEQTFQVGKNVEHDVDYSFLTIKLSPIRNSLMKLIFQSEMPTGIGCNRFVMIVQGRKIYLQTVWAHRYVAISFGTPYFFNRTAPKCTLAGSWH